MIENMMDYFNVHQRNTACAFIVNFSTILKGKIIYTVRNVNFERLNA